MYLQNLDLKIEIYIFDKDYPDDLLPIFKSKFESIGKQELSKGLGLTQNSIYKIRETLKNAKNINNIIDQTGINRQKFERLFRFIMQRSESNSLLFPEKENLPL
jgi:predicted nucleotidyltransferase